MFRYCAAAVDNGLAGRHVDCEGKDRPIISGAEERKDTSDGLDGYLDLPDELVCRFLCDLRSVAILECFGVCVFVSE